MNILHKPVWQEKKQNIQSRCDWVVLVNPTQSTNDNLTRSVISPITLCALSNFERLTCNDNFVSSFKALHEIDDWDDR